MNTLCGLFVEFSIITAVHLRNLSILFLTWQPDESVNANDKDGSQRSTSISIRTNFCNPAVNAWLNSNLLEQDFSIRNLMIFVFFSVAFLMGLKSQKELEVFAISHFRKP